MRPVRLHVLTLAGLSANAATLRRMLADRSEEHTSELQSQSNLGCRPLLEKKNEGRPDTIMKALPGLCSNSSIVPQSPSRTCYSAKAGSTSCVASHSRADLLVCAEPRVVAP